LGSKIRLAFFEGKKEKEGDDTHTNGRVGHIKRGPMIAINIEIKKINHLTVLKTID
jgi:hypothetical protein